MWPSLSSSNDHPHPLHCHLSLSAVPKPARKKWNNQKSALFPKLGMNRSGFSPSVGDQMVSEITVAKGPKLALPPVWKVKMIQTSKKYNQIQANQMVASINGLVHNFVFAHWAAGFVCWVLSAQRSPTWWSSTQLWEWNFPSHSQPSPGITMFQPNSQNQ